MELPPAAVFAFALLGVFVVIHSVVLLGMLRMLSQVYAAVFPGAAPAADASGNIAPSFVAEAVSGSVIDSADFKGRLTALLFVAPTCESCEATLDELEIVRAKAAGNVVVICSGQPDECQPMVDKVAPVEVVHDRDGRIRRLYDVKQTPYAVLIGKSGRIQSYGAPERGDLEALVEQPEALVEQS